MCFFAVSFHFIYFVQHFTQAYDSVECAVRKATVFCMVAIYGAVGEVMNTYLTELSTCKSKLLKLYIDRSLKDNK